MDSASYVKAKEAEAAALAADVEAFKKRGGVIQVLGPTDHVDHAVSAGKVHTNASRRESAKKKMQESNRALFRPRSATPNDQSDDGEGE